ncbi:hypothetical protein ACFWZ2_23055 [Streptomyces sp. NPDC059002]|uniref:hypothetical protein n=1 Tax=Streptomyces sp. NPDC059002 TaxID=3346690 RepID=UPI0036808938
MSSRALRAYPRRATWPRTLLTLVVLPLLILLAPPHTTAPALTPPTTLSTEPGPETQQDTTDTALRLPTRHATRLPTPTPHRPRTTPATPLTEPQPRPHPHLHVPTPRSVVLRC